VGSFVFPTRAEKPEGLLWVTPSIQPGRRKGCPYITKLPISLINKKSHFVIDNQWNWGEKCPILTLMGDFLFPDLHRWADLSRNSQGRLVVKALTISKFQCCTKLPICFPLWLKHRIKFEPGFFLLKRLFVWLSRSHK
jgi:hypothetical protein